MKARNLCWALVCVLGAFPVTLWASGDDAHGGDEHAQQLHFAASFLFVVFLVLVGRAGAIVQRWGFPSVLGELVAGIALINGANAMSLSQVAAFRDDDLIKMMSFIGVILLLFKTGLEEDLGKMLKVGPRAIVVALIGVVLPFAGGYLLSALLFSESSTVTHIFIGATLVATSVGITAKMFDDMGYKEPTKTLVIGAAVVDDIIGLIVLAVVAVMAAGGVVSVGLVASTTAGAVGFLVVSSVAGFVAAPIIGKFLSGIHTGVGMKQAMALLFCAVFSWAALATVGLEPIVGAFAAGLILTPVHFRDFDLSHQVARLDRWMARLQPDQRELMDDMREQKHQKEHSHVEHLIEGVARFFTPVFFVHTGMNVDITFFGDPKTIAYAAAFAVVAIAGKLACGLFAGSSNKAVTGWAMVARGEVGLVFATLGHAKGVFTDQIFAVAVVVVVVTTFVPPLVLPKLMRIELDAKKKAM